MARRSTVALLLAGLLVACAGPGESRRPPGRENAASAFFLSGEDTIEVRGFGPWALVRAELIAPDGSTQIATDLQATRSAGQHGLRPSVGVGASGGSRSGTDVGIGISIPVLGDSDVPAMISSRASFPIIEMETYRATWKLWRIVLRFAGLNPTAAQVELPAPEPPPRSERSR